MATKTKPAPSEITEDESIDWKTAPATEQEQVQRIRRLGRRISEYISYMCKLHGMEGSSAECKERALRLFYDRLLIVENQLARIHEGIRLE